jgi:hypothetical protein
MYGLSKYIDVSVFAEKELTLISFTINTIDLSFEDDLSITIEGSFIYCPGQPASAIKLTIPVSDSNLMCLIGKKVCFAERLNDGGIALHFDNDDVLSILDDSREYESFNIHIGGNEIII